MLKAVVVGFIAINKRADGGVERCGGATFDEGVSCTAVPTLETLFFGVRLACCGNEQCMRQVASSALVAISVKESDELLIKAKSRAPAPAV